MLKSENSFFYNLSPKALQLMRVGVALLLICDLGIRLEDFNYFYSDAGILPFDLLQANTWPAGKWTLHSGSSLSVALLFALAFVSAIALLMNRWPMVNTLLSFTLLYSLQSRNPYILQCGDDLLRLLLFWGMFHRWGNTKGKYTRFELLSTELGQVGYMLLLASLYTFSVFKKTGDDWRGTHDALYYALSLDQMVLPAGKWLVQFPELCRLLTQSVFWIELLGPFLLFIPYANQQLRIAFFFIFFILQLSIGLTLYVGLFFLIAIVASIGILPEIVLEKLENRFPRFFKVSKTAEAAIPLQPSQNLGFSNIKVGIAVLCLLLFLAINISTVSKFRLPAFLNPIIQLAGFDQNWGMFAPNVFKDDGWFILEGKTKAGKTIDLNRDGAATNSIKPKSIVSQYSNDRQRKYHESLLMNNLSFLREPYCSYWLGNWNSKHPASSVDTLSLIYMKELSVKPHFRATSERLVLYRLPN